MAAVASVTLLARTSSAEPTRRGSAGSDTVAAQALFNQALELVEARKWDEGCPKFRASLDLYPSASTAIHIARCHEHEGKTASAWEAYHRALALNAETQGVDRRKGLEELAKAGIDALEPKLSKVRIVVIGAPSSSHVLRDGVEVPSGVVGQPLPIDPGRHELTASATGRKTTTRSFVAEPGATSTVELSLESESGSSRVPTWAWAAGATGVVLTGVSVYFLADDLSAISALRTQCSRTSSATTCAPGYDVQHDNDRKNRDLPLFIGFGAAGLVALGAAVVGIVRTPSDQAAPTTTAVATPWFAPGGGGAALSGRF